MNYRHLGNLIVRQKFHLKDLKFSFHLFQINTTRKHVCLQKGKFQQKYILKDTYPN